MTLQQCTRQVDSPVIVVRLFLVMSISAVAQQADKKKLSATYIMRVVLMVILLV